MIIIIQMDLVLINGIQHVHLELIVPIISVPLLLILFVGLPTVILDMEIMVQMELVLINGIQHVHPELIVTIINVPLLVIFFVLLVHANLDI